METAIWIIAIVEIVRAAQNFVPVIMNITERKNRAKLNNAFIESLKKENKEWCEELLKDFVEKEGESNE